MILIEQNNVQIAAAELYDDSAALAAFRVFRNAPFLSKSDLAAFMSEPSEERSEFEALFAEMNSVASGRYVRRVLIDLI